MDGVINPDGRSNDYYIFFLKNGKLQLFVSNGEFRYTTNLQCKLY